MGTRQGAFLWAAVVAAVCLAVLYGGRDVGLSDNGDYKRMMDTEGISYLQKDDNRYLFRRYYAMNITGETKIEQMQSAINTWDKNFYLSVQNYFVKASKLINYIYNLCTSQDVHVYAIFWLAVLYVLLYATAVYWVLSAIGVRWLRNITAGLMLLIFCDAGYILYFNSFYGEALQFISIFLILGGGLRWREAPQSIFWTVSLFGGIFLFAGAKPVNVLFAALIGLGTGILNAFWGHKNKLIYLLVGILILFCGMSYQRIPSWMNRDTLYQAVFFGILKGTDHPQKDLQELGLDPAYAVLAGSNAYLTEYPMDVHSGEFDAGFYQKISRERILRYYLRHPARLIEKLNTALENSASIRPAYLANSAEQYGEQTRRWGIWSEIRGHLWVLYKPWMVLPGLLMLTGYSVYTLIWRKQKRNIGTFGLCVLTAGIWLNLLLPILCNGEADLAKHMFLYCQLIDVFIFSGLIYSIRRLNLRQWVFYIAVISAICVPAPHFGKQVELGVWNGKPIRWDFLAVYADGTADLITHDVIASAAFDSDAGGNLWHISSIREWLNRNFVQCFSSAEASCIVPIKRRVLLPEAQKHLAQGGIHPHYWAFPSDACDNLYETAWYHTIQDKVALPSVTQVKNIRTYNKSFWLATPYCGETKMVRRVDGRGFVLHRSAEQPDGVRPVIRIDFNRLKKL